jgi:tRNA-specific 2-thiouridylase
MSALMAGNSKTNQKKPKVALGMSGGVDSSLCAHLLVEQGYDVTGVYLECWRAPGCRTEEDRKDALQVALSLDLPFQVLDFKEVYRNKVVANFFAEYKAGRTPNPDVLCNKEIKFGLFYDWAIENGFDYVATGHYAKISEVDGQKYLTIPKDAHKDQTYFLYLLEKNQLDHVIFPLEDLTKDEVRMEAKKRQIHVSDKKDSVGICFIGDINVHGFLKDELGENPGEVVDTSGNVIGSHNGLWFYTIGQRGGFSVNHTTVLKHADGTQVVKQNIPPFYVISKNQEKNQLMVGFGSEALSDKLVVSNFHWLVDPKILDDNLQVRIRHTGDLLDCQISLEKERVEVKLKSPVQGIAAGQSAVFYQKVVNNLICVGGGTISNTSSL